VQEQVEESAISSRETQPPADAENRWKKRRLRKNDAEKRAGEGKGVMV